MESQNRLRAKYSEQVAQVIRKAKKSLVTGGYSVIAACALLPLLTTLQTNPAGAFGTLAAILGGIGGNLIANIAQGAFDSARAESDRFDLDKLTEILSVKMQSDDDLSEAIAALINETMAMQSAFDALKDLPDQWDKFSKAFMEEASHLAGVSIVVEHMKIDQLVVGPSADTSGIRSLVYDYLSLVSNTTDDLRLGTIDPKFEIDTPIRLSQVYVDPSIVPIHSSGRKRPGRHEDSKELVENLLKDRVSQGAVLVGGPGAGKSAFVDRLANRLSKYLLMNQSDKAGARVNLESHPSTALPGLLPVRVSLQEFAAQVSSDEIRTGTTRDLWDYIQNKLASESLEDFVAPLKLILSGRMGVDGRVHKPPRRGLGGLLLLDGLDEVPGYQRTFVEQAIDAFARRFNHSIVFITCRSYSWSEREDRLMSEGTTEKPLCGFSVYEFLPFTPPQVEAFVERWYKAANELKHWPEETINHRIDTLQEATRLPNLIPLAERPLLLTLMSTLHTSRGELPQDRHTLYADCVDLMLEVWQRSKDLHIGGKTTVEGGLLEEFGLSSEQVERVLRKIAHSVHVQATPTGTRDNKLREGNIIGDVLRKEFRSLLQGSLDEADRLVSYLQRRAGILEYVGEDIFRLPHRTFREYLAACHLLDEPDSPKSLIDRFLENPTWWAEVYSLAVGRQCSTSYVQGLHVLTDTLESIDDDLGQPEHVPATLLDAARDINLPERQVESPGYSNLLESLVRFYFKISHLGLNDQIITQRGSIFANTDLVLIPHVVPLLEDEISGSAAAAILEAYGGKELTTSLLPFLEHDDPTVRERAAYALGGTGNREAAPALSKTALDEAYDAVALKSIEALTRIGGDTAIDTLLHAIGSSDSDIRRAAAEGLGQIGDDRVVVALHDRAETTDPMTGASIAQALASLGTSEAISCLLDLLNDDDLSTAVEEALISVAGSFMEQLREAYENAEDEETIYHLRNVFTEYHLRFPNRRYGWDSTDVDQPPILWREDDMDFTEGFYDDGTLS